MSAGQLYRYSRKTGATRDLERMTCNFQNGTVNDGRRNDKAVARTCVQRSRWGCEWMLVRTRLWTPDRQYSLSNKGSAGSYS